MDLQEHRVPNRDHAEASAFRGAGCECVMLGDGTSWIEVLDQKLSTPA